jgi:sugar/nucleoside kinase (ribokinase family)
VLRRAARYGVGTDLIQVDPLLPTGFVRVHVDEGGNGSYEICAPVAWDAIEATETLLARAARARAIVFGSLAQRNATTRATIERLWEVASDQALMVCDVNLRPPHDELDVIRASLKMADVVKLSDAELALLSERLGSGAGDERTYDAAYRRAVRLQRGMRHARQSRRGAVARRRVQRASRLPGRGARHRGCGATRSSPCCWPDCSRARRMPSCCSTRT